MEIFPVILVAVDIHVTTFMSYLAIGKKDKNVHGVLEIYYTETLTWVHWKSWMTFHCSIICNKETLGMTSVYINGCYGF